MTSGLALWPTISGEPVLRGVQTGAGIEAPAENFLNLFRRPDTHLQGPISGADMPDQASASNLRKWAAEAVRQAKLERNAEEARRLLSFAQYWTRLADAEDWQRDQDAA
jgi:hypothetical protein